MIAESDLAFVDKNLLLESLALSPGLSSQLKAMNKGITDASIVIQPISLSALQQRHQQNNNNNNNNNTNNNNNNTNNNNNNSFGISTREFPLSSGLLANGMDGLIRVLSKGSPTPANKRRIERMILSDMSKLLHGGDINNNNTGGNLNDNSSNSPKQPPSNKNSRAVQALLGEDR